MGTKGASNRQRIIDAADNLFYRRGYNQTSFQDISDATDIPRGNFYYYFKTKNEILGAVVKTRIVGLSVVLKQCEVTTNDAKKRLLLFIDMLANKREDVIEAGCPLGSLSSELAKPELTKDAENLHEVSRQAFDYLRDWIKQQFTHLGKSNADELAMDLLAKIQGVAVIACAFKDVDYIQRSHADIKQWITDVSS